MPGRAARATRQFLVLAGTSALVVTLLSACTSRSTHVGSGHFALTDLISLSTTRVAAGTPIKAVFIVDNPGDPLKLSDSHGCRPAFGVTLTSESFGLPCIGAPITLNHGINRFPVIVSTTYQECLPPDGSSSASVPACVSGDMPRLAPGIYHARLESLGLSLPNPRPVEVTLTG